MQDRSFRFSIQELGGALGDLGTLLPLMLGIILINGLNPTSVLVLVGLFYIGSGLYYRVPIAVQPMKAVTAIAITLGLSATVIGTAGLIMGVILLLLSLTNLISTVVRLFPQAVVRGIQLSIGLILLRKGVELVFSEKVFASQVISSFNLGQFPIGILLAALSILIFIFFKFVFFRDNQHFPASLALIIFGIGAGVFLGRIPGVNEFGPVLPSIVLPSAASFWMALVILIIPQLPLTLGNSVVGTDDTAKTYFGDRARRVNPKALTMSMGLANIAAGLLGAMPMCHGSGGLTAHYKLGARTGGANLMIGGLLLLLGLVFGSAALPFLSLIPLSVLGILLAIVGIYHTLLIRDLKTKKQLSVMATVAITTLVSGNLAFGFGAGILLYQILRLDISGIMHSLARRVKNIKQIEKRVKLKNPGKYLLDRNRS